MKCVNCKNKKKTRELLLLLAGEQMTGIIIIIIKKKKEYYYFGFCAVYFFIEPMHSSPFVDRFIIFSIYSFIFSLLTRRGMALNIAKGRRTAHLNNIFHIFNKGLYRKHTCRNFSAMSTTSTEDAIKSVIICGPSGVGKGTIITKLLQDFPTRYALSVSHTSRSPRPGETNGMHYHFVDREFMKNDIQNGPWKYLEHAEVHGNLYGTREDAVRSIHEAGKVCVLDLDTSGVKQLKESKFPVRLVFIAPPSMRELETRLRGRGTEKEEQIQTRVRNAQKEVDFGLEPGNFDVVLVNDNLDKAYSALVKQLDDWFPAARSVR
jgi:guanylate kinase